MQTYSIARLDEIDPAAGDPIINEYDEDSEPAEELFIVVSGRAIFELEGEEVDATRGTLVFTAQGTRRTAVAAEPMHARTPTSTRSATSRHSRRWSASSRPSPRSGSPEVSHR